VQHLPELALDMARTHYKLKNNSEAKKYYHQSLLLQPKNPELLTEYAEFLIQLGEKEKAERYLQRVLLFAPKHPKALLLSKKLKPPPKWKFWKKEK
jgi:Tfp pilus assembly protein PilF